MPSDTFAWMQRRVRVLAGSAWKNESRLRQGSLDLPSSKTSRMAPTRTSLDSKPQARDDSALPGIGHRLEDQHGFYSSFSHLETPALKLIYFLQSIAQMDHAPAEGEFSKVSYPPGLELGRPTAHCDVYLHARSLPKGSVASLAPIPGGPRGYLAHSCLRLMESRAQSADHNA